MDKLRRLVQDQRQRPTNPEYEPLNDADEQRRRRRDGEEEEAEEEEQDVGGDGGEAEFSWLVYSIFLILGVAMLWAWYVFFLTSTIPTQIKLINT